MAQTTQTRQRWGDAVLRGILAGLVLSIAFLAGVIVGDRLPADAQEHRATDFSLLNEVEALVDDHYLRDLPAPKDLEYGAVRGYLETLDDPYTFFIDPPVAQSESEVLAGQYGGIGVQVKLNERGMFVLYPFRDGPAAQAGIVDGEILLAVDGVPIAAGERVDVVDRMLRGEVGDGRGVTITVRPPDSDEPRDVSVEFAVVQVPSVVWRIVNDDPVIGYIQLLRFTARTPDELRTALSDLRDQDIVALVLDLRGNSGGLLQESVEVAGEFLDGGTVFYEARRDGETEIAADAGGAALDYPLVVLIDGRTASASELVAGALRDRERATLIGQKSFGKGSVQLIFQLSDKSSVHITSAEWFTPARVPLAGAGLEPDIPMIPAEDGRDVEMGEAIRYLQTELTQEPLE